MADRKDKIPSSPETDRFADNSKAQNAPHTASEPGRKAAMPTQHTDQEPNVSDQGGRMTPVQPSGVDGGNPATAGPGQTQLQSDTPENRGGHINPSATTEATEGPSTNLGGHNPTAKTPGKEGAGDLRRRAEDQEPDKAA